MTTDEALKELIDRFMLEREAAMIVYGTSDTPAVVQAFDHAIRMTQRLRDELQAS